MDRREIEQVLLQRLSEDFGLADISAATPLFSAGRLDSVHMLELVITLDEIFGVSVPALEVSLDRFDSVERISAYLSTLIAERR